MSWRFELISDDVVEIMICRDTDSGLTKREEYNIQKFKRYIYERSYLVILLRFPIHYLYQLTSLD
jgi:hypothetical protein